MKPTPRQIAALFVLAALVLFNSLAPINRVVTAQTARQWPTRLQAVRTPADITLSREFDLDSNDELGLVVGIGDFNGDHITDVLVSYSKFVRGSDDVFRDRMIRYGIFFGKPNPPEPVNINIDKGTPDLTLDFDFNLISFISTVGDVNGDRVDDLLLFERFQESGLGNLRILFGSPRLQPGHLNVGQQTPDIRVINPTPTRFDPMAVRTADLNGDGVKDLILGEALFSSTRMYGVFGPFAPGSVIDLRSPKADLVITDNTQRGSQLLPPADVNGDGKADIVVARFGSSSPTGFGPVQFAIIFGSATAGREISLTDGQADATYDLGFTGGSFAVGDVNGDGNDDLIIGRTARFDDGPLTSGSVDVIFGSPTLHGPIDHVDAQVSGLPPTDAFAFSTQADLVRRLGAPIVARDLNGDGYADLVLGTLGIEDDERDETLSPGRAHVIFGAADFGSVSLEKEQQDVTIIFGKRQRSTGSPINVGDFNGDGLGDVLINGLDIRIYFGAPLSPPQIAQAKYRPGAGTLTLSGSNFTGAARIEINGVAIDREVTFLPDQDQLVLRGSKAELNLLDGKNQVTVSRKGARSNTVKVKMK